MMKIVCLALTIHQIDKWIGKIYKTYFQGKMALFQTKII